jgi:DNA repair protein RadA/Sms
MATAPKPKSAYVCNACGARYPKWAGQCQECGAWNSLQEVAELRRRPAERSVGYAGLVDANRIETLAEVSPEERQRVQSGIGELDRVLGGGLVGGSVVLIGGDPGIGKSTLLLQACAALAADQPVLYVSGEESPQQIGLRARRLGLSGGGIRLLAETCVEQILAHAEQERPRVMVVDSIQTLYTETLQSAPGSVSQVRESAAQLVRFAKQRDTVVFLVGHVTKDGALAGPRVLEHMVDTVLYFEGEHGGPFRIVRSIKNRFGAVNELGVFSMGDQGLREVKNPSAIFLSRHDQPVSGSLVMVTREGTRPLLVEVQALVDESPLANPRRVALGWTRTGCRCCWRCCTGMAASACSIRTSSSMSSAGCASPRRRRICRCCWRCCRAIATGRCRSIWRPSARSGCRARYGRFPMARTGCARRSSTASGAPSCPRAMRPRRASRGWRSRSSEP